MDVMSLVFQSLTAGKEDFSNVGLEKGRQVLNTLCKMLGHKYPKIRKRKFSISLWVVILDCHICLSVDCAEVLYLVFLSTTPAAISVSNDCPLDRVSDVLLATAWNGEDIEAIYAGMNEIMRILGFEEIVRDTSSANATAVKKSDELDSYEALVREAGMLL